MEGRRSLSTGEEFRDEVGPNEMANALLRKVFAQVVSMVRVGVVAWLEGLWTPGVDVSVLVGCAVKGGCGRWLWGVGCGVRRACGSWWNGRTERRVGGCEA